MQGSSEDDFIIDLCGGRDRIYTAGTLNGSIASLHGLAPLAAYQGSAPEQKMLIASYYPDGYPHWYRFIGNAGNGTAAMGLAGRPGGGVFALGHITADIGTLDGRSAQIATQGNSDMMLVALDKQGAVDWFTYFGGSGNDTPRKVLATRDGGALLLGTVTADIPSLGGITPNRSFIANDGVMAKFSSSGQLEWYTFFGVSGGAVSVISGATYLDTGYVLIGSASQDITSLDGQSPIISHSTPGTNDLFIAQVDLNGIVQWFTILGGTNNQTGLSIQVNDAGESFFGGGTNGDIPTLAGLTPLLSYNAGTDALFGKLSASGQLLSYGIIGTASNKSIESIALLRNGNVVMGCSAPNISSLAGRTPSIAHSGGTDDLGIFEFARDLELQAYAFMGGTGGEYNALLIPDYSGGFVVGGNTFGEMATYNGHTTLNTHASFVSGLEDLLLGRFFSVRDM